VTVPRWATDIRPGGPADFGQKVIFRLTPDKPELFTEQPAVSLDGMLTFLLAPNATGTTMVKIVAEDDGPAGSDMLQVSQPQEFQATRTHALLVQQVLGFENPSDLAQQVGRPITKVGGVS
jgi:hypothetical protein